MIVLKCIVGHHGACARSILVKLLTWIRTCCWQPSILNVSHRDELMYHFCTRTILPCIRVVFEVDQRVPLYSL